MKPDPDGKDNRPAAELLADWRAAERDTLAAKKAAEAARLAVAASVRRKQPPSTPKALPMKTPQRQNAPKAKRTSATSKDRMRVS